MGKTKGILKIVGGLTPVVVSIASLATGLTLRFACDSKEDVYNDFKNTQTYSSQLYLDSYELNESLAKGDISYEDYTQKFDYIGSDDYVEEVINEKKEESFEYLSRLKVAEKYNIASITTIFIALAGFLFIQADLVIANNGIEKRAILSGIEDIKDAKIEKQSKKSCGLIDEYLKELNNINPYRNNQEINEIEQKEEHLIDIEDDPVQFAEK